MSWDSAHPICQSNPFPLWNTFYTPYGPGIVGTSPWGWASIPIPQLKKRAMQINILHLTETLREFLSYENAYMLPSHCWFTKGALCWVDKNPSRLPGCPRKCQKGDARGQQLRSQEERDEKKRQALGSGSSRWMWMRCGELMLIRGSQTLWCAQGIRCLLNTTGSKFSWDNLSQEVL